MKHRKAKFTLMLLFITCILALNFSLINACNNPGTVDYEKVKSELKDTVIGLMKENNVPGVSIALVDDQQVVMADGFSIDPVNPKAEPRAYSEDPGAPIRPNTIFRVASISKLFTATAIMRLVDQGRIDLDQPLQTYLPQFEMKSHFGNAGNITIRSLLTHHSGLPDVYICGIESTDPEFQFTSPLPGLKDEYVAYPPNYMYSYSNLGFELLGEVIAAVTRQPFSQYMETEILKPLGMNLSSFQLKNEMKPYLMPAYTYNEGCYEPYPQFYFRGLAAGGLYSTASELSNFIKMVFGEGIFQNTGLLKSETLARMLTPQNPGIPLDLNSRTGLAWGLEDFSGNLGYAGKVASHDGGYSGYESLLAILPDHKLGVCILTNSETGAAIKSKIASKALSLALEAKTGLTAPPEPTPKSLPKITLNAMELKQYKGYYAIRLGGVGQGMIVIEPKGGTCYLRGGGNETGYVMQFHEGHWFSLPEVSENVYYKVTRINHQSVLLYKTAYRDQDITLLGEKLTVHSLPQIWRQRCGKYQVVNDPACLDTVLELLIQDQFLLLKAPDEEKILTPLSVRQALIRGLGQGGYETIRFIKDGSGKECLYFSGLKMEKIANQNQLPRPSRPKRMHEVNHPLLNLKL